MRKIIVLSFIVLSTGILWGQASKGKYILRLDGNYIKDIKGSGVISNADNEKQSLLQINPSIGKFISDKIEIGVGINFLRSNQLNTNQLKIDDVLHLSMLENKSYAIIPTLNLAYNHSLSEKLIFNCNFNVGTGKIHSKVSSIEIDGYNLPHFNSNISESDSMAYRIGAETTSETTYFSFSINPEISYFFTTHFSSFIQFGGIQYSMYEWKRETENIIISCNPVYWKLGLLLVIN